MGLKRNSKVRRELKRRLSAEQNHRCCLCGGRLDESPSSKTNHWKWEATFEHIVSKSKGGKHGYYNLALSHKICNLRRGDRN